MLTENRHGLVVNVELTQSDGHAERDAALTMLERSVQGLATLGADQAYGTRDFVWDLRGLGVTPRVAQNERGRRSAIDGRTTRHEGYRQRQRKRVEEVFGWIKTVGAGGKLRYLGRARNKLWLELTVAYNLTRRANIEATVASLNRADAASSIGSSAPVPALSLTGPVQGPCSACVHSSTMTRFGTC